MSPDDFDAELPEKPQGPLEDLPLHPETEATASEISPVRRGERKGRARASLFPSWNAEEPGAAPSEALPFPPDRPNEEAEARGRPERAAGLTPRLLAAFGDALLPAATAGIAYFAALGPTGAEPTLEGAGWALLFALYFSFAMTTLSLALFGRTPGMALADLTARDGEDRLPGVGPSLLRWAGSAATALLAFLPLLWVLIDQRRRTPADRLSGRPLRRATGRGGLL